MAREDQQASSFKEEQCRVIRKERPLLLLKIFQVFFFFSFFFYKSFNQTPQASSSLAKPLFNPPLLLSNEGSANEEIMYDANGGLQQITAHGRGTPWY